MNRRQTDRQTNAIFAISLSWVNNRTDFDLKNKAGEEQDKSIEKSRKKSKTSKLKLVGLVLHNTPTPSLTETNERTNE